MADPWLTIIGLGEDGPAGLTDASRAALAGAEIIIGGPRHLALVGAGARGVEWPVPFDMAPVLARRGRATVVLASGDPFWYGAGGSLARHLARGEWRVLAAPSIFSRVAGELGWRIEDCTCLGLHAAPFARLMPHLAQGAQIIATLRDGAAPAALAEWLTGHGFGASTLWVMSRMGGPHQAVVETTAAGFDARDIPAPVAMAIAVQGAGLPRATGLPDDLFRSDGQITKRPIRAITLSTLAPRPDQVLWDLGAGSGSISVEWCLSGGIAHAVEGKPNRVENIAANAAAFGLDHRMSVHQGASLAVIATLPRPDAIFVGGGFDAALFGALLACAKGARLVVNTVTLETEALVIALQAQHGGDLMKIDTATVAPLGRLRGWEAARPVVQWSVTL